MIELGGKLPLEGRNRLQTDKTWALNLQGALLKTLKECFGNTWGYDHQNNWGFVYDLEAMADMPDKTVLQIEERSVHAQGIEVRATVSKDIASISELTKAIHDLFTSVAESFLIILPLLDSEALRYWFATGSASHGHIGVVIIKREDIQHLDLSALEMA